MNSMRVWTFFLVIAASGLAGCVTAAGAIVGGAAGHKIGGDTTSTIGGAVVGGMIGHEIAK